MHPRTSGTALEDVRANWEYFGTTDPLWGVLSKRKARNNGWDLDEFFRTGVVEVADLMKRVDRHLPGLKRQDALDFGCGVARLTRPLAEQFATVTGIDISRPMLDKARSFGVPDNLTLVYNTKSDLSVLLDETFDFVLCHIVLQHMPPALALGYLAEFYRVLKPGGGLVFTLPSVPDTTKRGGLAYALLPRPLIYRVRKLRDKAVMQMNAIRHDVLVDVLEQLGFEVAFLEPSSSGARNWLSFRYFVRKPLG